MSRRLLLCLPVALVLSACGSSDPGSSAGCQSADPTVEAPSSVSTDLATEPAVEGTEDPPPCDLVVADVVVGDGAVADVGSPVEVRYVGAFYETGAAFDASWDRGADSTLPFTAGAPGVIEGFGTGVVGMAEGGRRVITIPSDLGYGAAGQGPIPGDATLVFVVDLVSVG